MTRTPTWRDFSISVLSSISLPTPHPLLALTWRNSLRETWDRYHGGWRPWQQSSQSSCHSTIGTRQTEYHEALPSSVNDEVRCDRTFADDGNTSWYSVCRVPMVEWQLDCEDCCHGRQPPWYRSQVARSQFRHVSWTAKTVVNWRRSSISMIPDPGSSWLAATWPLMLSINLFVIVARWLNVKWWTCGLTAHRAVFEAAAHLVGEQTRFSDFQMIVCLSDFSLPNDYLSSNVQGRIVSSYTLRVLSNWDRRGRLKLLSHHAEVYWQRANQSYYWPYNAKRVAGQTLKYQFISP